MGNQIDAIQLKNAFLAGAASLNARKDWINELNVFPVPDGDTGTNMTMTIMSAAREVAAIEAPTLDNVAKAMAGGSLRGARGNSGVILSQLIRGFTKEIREHADQEAVDIIIIARAFGRAVETAYKAVMKPKEGTILTVAKGMAECAFCAEGRGDFSGTRRGNSGQDRTGADRAEVPRRNFHGGYQVRLLHRVYGERRP